jgi:hypothetical protein
MEFLILKISETSCHFIQQSSKLRPVLVYLNYNYR